jgi:hypothetical protein
LIGVVTVCGTTGVVNVVAVVAVTESVIDGAVPVTKAGTDTVATNVSTVPTGNLAIVHSPAVTPHVNVSGPPDCANATVDAGVVFVVRVSFTFTVLASDGPELVIVIVYVPVPGDVIAFPGGAAVGDGDVCTFVNVNVAIVVTVVENVFDTTVSTCPVPVDFTVAVFLIGLGVEYVDGTCKFTAMMSVPVPNRAPAVPPAPVPHCTVVPDNAQLIASGPDVFDADTKFAAVKPVGNGSVNCTVVNGTVSPNVNVYCKFGEVAPGVTDAGPAFTNVNG